MTPTRFWLIRHALVERNARAALYGTLDVPLCAETMALQSAAYAGLAGQLPRPATWHITPLSRTRLTAEAIFTAGYPATPLTVEPALIEQELGDWQGLRHADLPPLLRSPTHPFWPLGPDEHPPGGESMADVIARVGPAIDRLAAAATTPDIVIVAHGGSIRAAIAHALGIAAGPALHLAIANISLSRMERWPRGWRVTGVNQLPPFTLAEEA